MLNRKVKGIPVREMSNLELQALCACGDSLTTRELQYVIKERQRRQNIAQNKFPLIGIVQENHYSAGRINRFRFLGVEIYSQPDKGLWRLDFMIPCLRFGFGKVRYYDLSKKSPRNSALLQQVPRLSSESLLSVWLLDDFSNHFSS